MSKAITWILVTVFALALAALGFLLAANWQDEPLSEASRRTQVYVAPIGNQLLGNGHVLLMGLDAPPPEKARADAVEPARQLGLKILQREQERWKWNARHGSLDADAAPKLLDPGNAAITAAQILAEDLRCAPEQSDCIAWAVQHRKQLAAADPARRAVLARLAAIANAPQYANVFPIHHAAQVPPVAVLRAGAELQLMQAALLWNDKAYDKALDQLELTERMRQRIAQSNNLVASVFATSSLNHGIVKWISNVITRDGKRLRPQDAERLQKILEAPRISLRNGMYGEMVSSASVIQSLGIALKLPPVQAKESTADAKAADSRTESVLHTRRFINERLFLPHQSTNIATQGWQLTMDLADLPPNELQAAQEAAADKRKALIDARPRWLGARNIIGARLFDQPTESADYVQYIRRGIDVDGFRRLALLQLLAAQQRVADDGMPAWLAASPAALRNPYDGQPMPWDSASRSLSFEGSVEQPQNPGRSKTYRVNF
ncbi:hypothetical protein [Diaphorobacter aerolatus]|uniref:Uncharacterized protein n=1 Tax=Diaphorobacter aerolatus TaxID=1288495 RepID=A0A7H0GL71_9BURK|nr:hypothetical protein [Diaphorobacter aerolatus]QNP49037.1 hypothetical protein H9K75_02430 [Diaphorobacter aerolatus]